MEPKTRKEHYLAKIAGEDVTVPEPKTRQEYYLKEIAENGSGGSGGGGIFPVTTTITVTVIQSGEVEHYSFSFSDANHTDTEILEALAESKLPVLFATVVYEGESIPGRRIFYFAWHSQDGITFEALNAIGNYIRVFNGNKVYGELK